MEPTDMFVLLLVMFFVALIFAAVTRIAKVDARTGASSGCLGLIIGVFGCYFVVYQMANADMFGHMPDDIKWLTVLSYGLPSGVVVGALLGCGIAALTKRKKKP